MNQALGVQAKIIIACSCGFLSENTLLTPFFGVKMFADLVSKRVLVLYSSFLYGKTNRKFGGFACPLYVKYLPVFCFRGLRMHSWSTCFFSWWVMPTTVCSGAAGTWPPWGTFYPLNSWDCMKGLLKEPDLPGKQVYKSSILPSLQRRIYWVENTWVLDESLCKTKIFCQL